MVDIKEILSLYGQANEEERDKLVSELSDRFNKLEDDVRNLTKNNNDLIEQNRRLIFNTSKAPAEDTVVDKEDHKITIDDLFR